MLLINCLRREKHEEKHEGRAEGKPEGIILAMKALGKSMTEVIEVFSDLMKISKEEAETKVKGLWDSV